MTSHALPAVIPSVGSLEAYIQMAYRAPMLSQEQEQTLATRWHDNKDVEAARQLVLTHIRYVIGIVRQYRNFGMPQSDLIQEGTIGLMKAVKRFDPSVGARLSSFAIHWIKSEIHEYILKNWRMVKVATTKAQRKLFFNLHKHLTKKSSLTGQEVLSVAEELDVRPQDVTTMETRLHGQDVAYDGAPESSETLPAPAQWLTSRQFDPAIVLERTDWESKRLEKLHQALESLNEREQLILNSRWLTQPKLTLHELAEKLDVSPERVRQLEKKAMKKIAAHMGSQAA